MELGKGVLRSVLESLADVRDGLEGLDKLQSERPVKRTRGIAPNSWAMVRLRASNEWTCSCPIAEFR